jgi:hypothetical protein
MEASLPACREAPVEGLKLLADWTDYASMLENTQRARAASVEYVLAQLLDTCHVKMLMKAERKALRGETRPMAEVMQERAQRRRLSSRSDLLEYSDDVGLSALWE